MRIIIHYSDGHVKEYDNVDDSTLHEGPNILIIRQGNTIEYTRLKYIRSWTVIGLKGEDK